MLQVILSSGVVLGVRAATGHPAERKHPTMKTTIPAAASTEEQTCYLVLTRQISWAAGQARDDAARVARMFTSAPTREASAA